MASACSGNASGVGLRLSNLSWGVCPGQGAEVSYVVPSDRFGDSWMRAQPLEQAGLGGAFAERNLTTGRGVVVPGGRHTLRGDFHVEENGDGVPQRPLPRVPEGGGGAKRRRVLLPY